MSSSYRNTLNQWLAQLDVKADRVLDIGGAQEPAKGRTKSWEVEDYLIADLHFPHKSSPKPDYELDLNERDIEGNPEVPNNLYNWADLIFCLEVFDYVFDPVTAFLHLSYILKYGGTAWVSFPSFYPLHQPIEDDTLRYMPGGIEKLAKATGLTIKQMIPRRPETDLLEQWYRAERMRAAKHEDHNFMGWIVELTK